MSKRLKFFISHLAVSFCIGLFFIGLVLVVWYPLPLAKAVDVTNIFLMMLVIDVVIGPVLCFLIYKEGKKSLKFDLIVIIAIQFSALCYGIYSIEQGRPVWIAYVVDRFELVRKNEIIEYDIKKVLPEYQKSSWLKPQYVAVELSRDIKQRNDDMFAETLGGISLSQRPERYITFSKAKLQMQQRSQKLNELQKFNTKNNVDGVLQKYPQADAWLPLKASALDMVVLINKEKAEVVKIVDLRPWK